MTTNLEGWLTEASVKAWIARFKVIYADRHHDEIDALCRMALAALELKARVAELEHLQGMKAPDYLQETLKKENSDLRAQLEAAKERHFQAVYELGVEIEKNEKKPQLTAQPDGVRLRELIEPLECVCSPDYEAPKCVPCQLKQALAAPAPAPDECMACIGEKWGMPPGGAEPHTCEKSPAPAYDPKPDWRCQACEETGMRHCSDPANCGGMKAPAPACKTCGGKKKVTYPNSDTKYPCPACQPTSGPDCAKGEL